MCAGSSGLGPEILFRFYVERSGDHVHVRVYSCVPGAASAALNGTLAFSPAEYDRFAIALGQIPGCYIIEGGKGPE